MNKDIIIAFSLDLGISVDLFQDRTKLTDEARYYMNENVIEYYNKTSDNIFIFSIAHELGHSFQRGIDFSQIRHTTFIRKRNYVYHVERDAWRKAKLILSILYPNMTNEDWDEFVEWYTFCLDNYINLDKRTINRYYEWYYDESNKKRINRRKKKNIRKVCLDFSKKFLSLHHD